MNTVIEAPPEITRALQGDFSLSYGLEAQFSESMYLDRAIGEEREMAERWEGDVYAVYQMLLFVGPQTTSNASA
jgi:hypothetical protein